MIYLDILKLKCEVFQKWGIEWKRFSNGEFSLEISSNAQVDFSASIGYGASIGNRASIGKDEKFLTLGPLGSRQVMLTVVWTKAGLIFHTGCFHGPLDKFIEQVKSVHAGNEYGKEYMAVVELVKVILPEEGAA